MALLDDDLDGRPAPPQPRIAGAGVYAAKRPDPWPRTFGFHEVFHLLTVVGAGLHLAAIAFTALPRL